MAIRIGNVVVTTGLGRKTTEEFSTGFYEMLNQERTKLRGKERNAQLGAEAYMNEARQNVSQEVGHNEGTMMMAMYESMANRIRVDRTFEQQTRGALSTAK